MSSPILSDDEFDFTNYSALSYHQNRGPPLISKKARLLVASAQNDVDTLKELLDHPKWYSVRDRSGLNLLQIAIFTASDEVFDYLLSLDDFPLEAVDNDGATALVLALSYTVGSNGCNMSEHYAYELIKKGANIDKTCWEEEALLYCALERGFVRVARLLLERGADVYVVCKEESLLDKWFYYRETMDEGNDLTEALTMLLCYGPSICDDPFFNYTILDIVLKWEGSDDILVAQETLLYFTVDELNLYKISSGTLLSLVQNKSPLFHQVIKFTSEIILFEGEYFEFDWHHLFTIDLEYLRILLEKYPNFVKELLQSYSDLSYHPMSSKFDLKNFDMLIQSSLYSDVIELISNLNTRNFIPCIFSTGKNIDEIMEMIYYLLSYGMSLNGIDLEYIYKKTGYSEDFKNLFFMDVQPQMCEQISEMMLLLVYDVTFDIYESVEKHSSSLCNVMIINWDQIFNYFAHQRIQKAYQKKINKVIERQLPQIPLLQELARDAFRKYFIKIFKITSAKEFYTLVKVLPISSVYKKIITFESKLYYN